MDKILKNPIREIILSVSFDKNLDIGKLEEFCEKQVIKNDFPTSSPGFDAKLNLGDLPSSEFNHTGFILKSKESKNILNVKLGKISYHILDRYESYDSILDKLDKYWGALQSIFDELAITNISARYINQIKVLSGEKYEEYIRIKVNTPFDNIQSQFVNFSLINDSNIKSNVIIASNKDKDLILDIRVEKDEKKVLLKNISDIFIELRPIKNNIFQKLVTEKTKEKFEML